MRKNLQSTISSLEKKVNCILKNNNTSNFQLLSEKAQPNGYASLGADGIVPASQLPPFSSDSYWTLIGNDIQNNNTGAVFSRGGGNQTTNTAYGQLSLLGNTSGAFNTAYGYSALPLNTTGLANVAIGTYALNVSTVASYNTAIGVASMSLYTGGNNSQNTAIGAYSMRASTNGTFNTAVGSSALQNHTTGQGNTAIGFHALESRIGNLTGSNNIGIGLQAGRAVTTGSRNILIENTTNDGITTGSNNIIINPVDRCGITTGNNNVIIGGFNGVFAAALSNHMIFGTGNGVERFRVSDLGNMGIGTNNPNSSSIVDIVSTTKTLTIPRMNNAQQGAIISPLAGSIIYNTQSYNNLGAFQFRDSSSWIELRKNYAAELNIGTDQIIADNSAAYFSTGAVLSSIYNNGNAFTIGTGRFTNNTNTTMLVKVSGMFSYLSSTWNAGSYTDVRLGGAASKVLARIDFPTAYTGVVSISFSQVIPIPPGQFITLGLYQTSGSNKTIRTTLFTGMNYFNYTEIK